MNERANEPANPINTCENVNFMQNLQEIMWLKTENECVRDISSLRTNKNNNKSISRETKLKMKKKKTTLNISIRYVQ